MWTEGEEGFFVSPQTTRGAKILWLVLVTKIQLTQNILFCAEVKVVEATNKSKLFVIFGAHCISQNIK